MNPPRAIELGNCRVTLLSGGSLRLDGGAMFGIIPKALWSRAIAADEQNRIQLACNCLLVEPNDGLRRVIVETGHGAKYHDKEQGIFAIDPGRWLAHSLDEARIPRESITDVAVTHLHFDHGGGLTNMFEGALRPTFPNARVHVQRSEFEDARANFGIMTNTYREENYTPLDAVSAWNLIDGPKLDDFSRSGVVGRLDGSRGSPIAPRVWPIRTPGHTRGHQSLLIVGDERSLLYLGDVMPTRHHVGRPYNMGYDLFPIDNRDTKSRVLGLAAENEWMVVIDHEIETPVVRVLRDRDWYRLEALA